MYILYFIAIFREIYVQRWFWVEGTSGSGGGAVEGGSGSEEVSFAWGGLLGGGTGGSGTTCRQWPSCSIWEVQIMNLILQSRMKPGTNSCGLWIPGGCSKERLLALAGHWRTSIWNVWQIQITWGSCNLPPWFLLLCLDEVSPPDWRLKLQNLQMRSKCCHFGAGLQGRLVGLRKEDHRNVGSPTWLFYPCSYNLTAKG